MKKMFFYAALATVALVSCSKDNGFEAPFVEENETKEAIKFNLSSNINVTTRGKGAVGGMGTTEDPNNWDGEELYVYMFKKGTMVLAEDSTVAPDPITNGYQPYFENVMIKAPAADPNKVKDSFEESEFGGTKKYYGQNKYDVYDFFAYHADDAVYDKLGNRLEPTLNGAGDAFTVPVTIDGTQDLMVAKAGLNQEDTEKLQGSDLTRVYSAYSARRGVHPRFAFSHELSRFVFNAVSANGNAKDITITKVEVVANTEATMTVAATDPSKLGLSDWKTEGTLPLTDCIKDENNKYIFTQKQLGAENETVVLGKCMLLAPKAKVDGNPATYTLAVEYTNGTSSTVFNSVITAPAKTDNEFKKGYHYTVNIMVYGFEEIKLICDLTPWQDGGDIPVGDEE